jgi:hypothetical protein
MADQDEWDRDPAVKWMRGVFKAMERHQHRLITQLNVSLFDPRLRPGRERALALFNRAWKRARWQGIVLDEEKAGRLYAAGLSRILQQEGVVLPEALSSFDPEIEMLLKEEAS